VRVEAIVEVGKGSSLGIFLKELSVEDLSRKPSLDLAGEDRPEAFEPCRMGGVAGAAMVMEDLPIAMWDGDGSGDTTPFSSSAVG